ncbi:MAG: ATP-binding cassette domain-containing protein [Actinomycetota bacterium]|nr:ATP-binding cassette domain-containing protein [Actinomycetota bacterium]
MSALIEARGWGWRHAGRRGWALRGLDLRVEQGERVLLLGPSGAGKSTLLQGLAGLLNAPEAGDAEGALWVHGAPVTGPDRRTGIVFQDPGSSLVMARLGDEVAFGLENRAVPSEEIWPAVRAALDAVELGYPLDHAVEHLSGGEQQRLAIADVLAVAPRLWLLDEPTSNLDPPGAALVRDTVWELLRDASSTVVIVEHRVDELVDGVDRVVVLEPGGGVRHDGAPDEVFSRHGASLREAGVWVPGRAPARRGAPEKAGPPVVVADAVTVRYPAAAADALARVDLEVAGSQVTAVVGPNGSGKSTLALCLASLLVPTAGAVRFVAGGPATPYARWKPSELVRHVGTVFQEPEHQFVAATVDAELAVGAKRAQMPSDAARRRVGELLERLHLSHLAAANPFTLSGGEKRRLSVATALVADPELLVLDEPTFGQDARTWDELVDLLAAARARGSAIVTVTHDEDLVAALADRVVRLAAGRVVARTPAGEPL